MLLIIPEVCWNVLGTMWAFSAELVQCSPESFTKTVVEGEYPRSLPQASRPEGRQPRASPPGSVLL